MSGDGTRKVSVTRNIAAPAAKVFAVVRNPALHTVIDGSGTVKGASDSEPALLDMGSKFGMSMRMGVPYSIANEVVEYDPDRLIAWRHMGGHRWRYEIEPDGDAACTVTETFDWSTSRLPLLIQVMGMDQKHIPNMEKTLERLDRYVTTGSPD
jgi:uncharacterized protein YndB with AHSA1/START domain